MIFRHYQTKSIDKSIEYFKSGKNNGLVVLPTGTGKSLVQAGLTKYSLERHPSMRVVCATHSMDLVDQNHDEIMSLWPECPSGIYSAGLERRDSSAQVLFAGIQSIYNKANKIGHIDLVIIDEAHTLSTKTETRWQKFINDALAINPKMRILGLTATPYRLDSGNLVPKTFDEIIYEYSVLEAIKDGFLCEIVSAPVDTHLKTIGVHKRGGEFISGELERAVNTDSLNRACVSEIIKFGADRKSWIVFCSGKDHARNITDILLEYGVSAKCVTDDTPKHERRQIVKDHRSGAIKCLVNNMIFTTGYNNKKLDLLACLRPTESKGLWVQICGRLMRISEGKTNGLLLDFGRNIDRHGPIDKIKGDNKRESSGKGEAPRKQCPKCYEPLYAAARLCFNCGYEFPESEIDLTVKASTGALLSTQLVPQTYSVFSVKYQKSIGRDGKKDSMVAIYTTVAGQIREWIFFDHPINSIPRINAERWAKAHNKYVRSVDEALMTDWPKPLKIEAVKSGKYWKVKKHIFNINEI